MRRLLLLLAALAGPLTAQEPRERIERAVRDSGFQGVYAVSRNGERVAGGATGEAAPGRPFTYEAVFPWLSVTKQAVATMVMQEAARGRVALDAPASRYLPALTGGTRAPTVRELLEHRSGLRDPDNSPRDVNGVPGFHGDGPPGIEWCVGGRGAPGGPARHNDCDYLVLGGVLERASGRPLADLFAERIAGPAGARARFAGAPIGLDADTVWAGGPGIPMLRELGRLGSAGGLIGSASDLLAMDEGLLSGALLPDDARGVMWRNGEAFGQTSFGASLRGCAAPVTVVERRGALFDFQVRNVLVPELGLAMVLMTNQGRDRLDLGDIAQGRGVVHDALAAAACA